MAIGMTSTSTAVTITGGISLSGLLVPSATQEIKQWQGNCPAGASADIYTVPANKVLYVTFFGSNCTVTANLVGSYLSVDATQVTCKYHAGRITGYNPTIVAVNYNTPIKLTAGQVLKIWSDAATADYEIRGIEVAA